MNERQEGELEDGNEPDIEAMARSRKFLKEQARKAIYGSNPNTARLCGMLFEIEHAAEPFFLGEDYAEDDDDLNDLDIF